MTKLMEGNAQRQSDLRYLLDRLDDQIRIEMDLIGQRMNVLVVSQAFLFAAYSTDLLVEQRFERLRTTLLHRIPAIGIFVSVLVGLSLFAAVMVVRARKEERDIVRDRLCDDLRKTTLAKDVFSKDLEILAHVSPSSLMHGFGNYPPLGLAPVFLACWIRLLYRSLT